MPALRKKRKPLALTLACLAGIANGGCALLGSQPVVLTATTLCRDWPVLTRSKDDKLTKETAATMAASNACSARVRVAIRERNEAKG